ncbi:MAG: hypothetical protein HKO69_05565 [Woeseiaceae bacterium]|nr:hypothetical protein [Woeseiaceae bacterium]
MKNCIALVATACLVLACVAAPTLEARPGGNPEQVDLSGQWILRGDVMHPGGEGQMIRIPSAVRRDSDQRRSERSSKGASVRVFIESGRSLKVTQTVYGLFFSYDRAIVEEYNFGENRDVNVGPIKARRVAGWDGVAFVIETMDERGNVLAESWRLEQGGAVLVRHMTITERGKRTLDTRQVFDRA